VKSDSEIEEVTIRISGFSDFVDRPVFKKNLILSVIHHHQNPLQSRRNCYFICISNYIVIGIIAFCLFGFSEIKLKIAKNNLSGNWIDMIFPVLYFFYE
jgi:hypothetical protein